EERTMTTAINNNDIETRALTTRTELDRLETEAQQLEAQARETAAAFERSPTEKGVAARAVAEQKAKNARTAVNTAKAEAQPLLDEASRAARQRELDPLRPRLNWRAELAPGVGRVEDVIATFVRDLQGAMVALDEGIAAHNERARRAENLATSLTGE